MLNCEHQIALFQIPLDIIAAADWNFSKTKWNLPTTCLRIVVLAILTWWGAPWPAGVMSTSRIMWTWQGWLGKNHNSIVKLLLEQTTVDLNCADKCGNTALHHAVLSGNVEGVQLLLADCRLTTVNCINFIGWTPVMSAIYVEQIACVNLLAIQVWTWTWWQWSGGTRKIWRGGKFEINHFSLHSFFCHRRRGFVEGERIVAEAREKRRREQGDIQAEGQRSLKSQEQVENIDSPLCVCSELSQLH